MKIILKRLQKSKYLELMRVNKNTTKKSYAIEYNLVYNKLGNAYSKAER